MNKPTSFSRQTFNTARLGRQAGVSSLQIVVSLVVAALMLAAGNSAFKYIDQTKANNDMQELNDIRAGLVDFAVKHNTNFATFSLAIGCRQQIFPANRCPADTGAAAAVTVSNGWGGTYTVTAVNVSNGTNNAARLTSTGYPDVACVKEVTYEWNNWAQIAIGGTTVKSTAVDVIDDNAINSACSAGTNTVHWTVRG